MKKNKCERAIKASAKNKARRVIIATPVAADGSVSIYYVDSLIASFRLAVSHDVELYPIFMANDVLIQRARNDLIALAIESQVDDLVWIDSDIQWHPEWLFRLLEHPVDVVGGTYPKKSDDEQYPVQVHGEKIPVDPKTGLLEVDGLGTGFLRLTRKALQALWDSNRPYTSNGKAGRWICEVLVGEDGEVIGEDIVLCHKLQALGYKIYLDAGMTCAHIGQKRYVGDFRAFLQRNSQTPSRGIQAR
jgi:glycosyltransferase involved in cell wall biosynthesis